MEASASSKVGQGVAASINAVFDNMAITAEARQLPAQAILDGTLLDRLAQQHIADFMKVIPLRSAGANLELTWGTICSGGEVVLFVLDSISRAFQAYGFTFKFKHLFSCEVKQSLQEWIAGVFQETNAACGCCFCRAEEMGQQKAQCVKHGCLCDVPTVDILIAGTSCKDFSKASSYTHRVYKANGGTLVLGLSSSVGGSAETFHGFSSYLQKHAVSIVLFENVDTIDEALDQSGSCQLTNLKVVTKKLEIAGLSVLTILTDSALFGLPQQRRRYYLLAVKIAGSPHFSFAQTPLREVFSTVRSFISVCQRRHPCASELILCQTDPTVESELNKRLALGRRGAEYNVAASISLFQGSGLRWGDVEVPRRVRDTPWFQTLSPLMRNVLTYSCAEHPQPALNRDISQSIVRLRYSRALEDGRHLGYCQMPHQVTWLEPDDQPPRLMLGRESLLLSGYPIAKIPNTVVQTTEPVMQGISGNMMASVVPLAILSSVCLALPWRTTEQVCPTTSEDVADAMVAFALCTSTQAEESENQPKRRKILRN